MTDDYYSAENIVIEAAIWAEDHYQDDLFNHARIAANKQLRLKLHLPLLKCDSMARYYLRELGYKETDDKQ